MAGTIEAKYTEDFKIQTKIAHQLTGITLTLHSVQKTIILLH